MKFLDAAFALLCLFAVFPALAKDPPPVPSEKFQGWSTTMRETGTIFFYCMSPKICGKGSIVSLHMHDLPAPTKAEIRARQNEPRLPIKCRSIGSYDSCEYPAAIDRKGRPTHYRPTPAEGFVADFFHCGFMSERLPPGSGGHFLITIVSSAINYQQARKNYVLFQSAVTH
ncbi:hypothetical protein [Pleomorphomonas koreensis]|uniref:hypothetical protein n=1 Tax=Pleomorphomonas koreensis TaxID=257440 RepID=UPI000417FEDC|nr:hypothetical protein [Pleomorphomonas koreensis]